MRAVALVFFGLAVYYRGLVAAEDADEAVGKLLDPCLGVTKPEETPCYVCTKCVAGVWNCSSVDCSDKQCVDGYTPPGQCCAVCPNGPNCKTHGATIPLDKTVTLPDGYTCRCARDEDNDQMMAMCTPPR
ncbi:unnamed protein product [Lymnaea stagnalis]|uniref:VWFC domain-containing protein n=1 Tax=Lymnaea stagnalis TaxID=6523 RepID=A0AAV2I7X1_LYMST